MSNESNYKAKNEVVLQGVPEDLANDVLAAIKQAYPVLTTATKGEPTNFGLDSFDVNGTRVYTIVHAGRLPRPQLEVMAAFGRGIIVGKS